MKITERDLMRGYRRSDRLTLDIASVPPTDTRLLRRRLGHIVWVRRLCDEIDRLRAEVRANREDHRA